MEVIAGIITPERQEELARKVGYTKDMPLNRLMHLAALAILANPPRIFPGEYDDILAIYNYYRSEKGLSESC